MSIFFFFFRLTRSRTGGEEGWEEGEGEGEGNFFD